MARAYLYKSVPLSSETRPSGRLSHAGQVQASAAARNKNLSELVKIISGKKILFNGDEFKEREESPRKTLSNLRELKNVKEFEVTLTTT